jgi:ABC-type Fe3+ transport system permease subunit
VLGPIFSLLGKGNIEMRHLNRDVVLAIILLLICSVLFWASFDIRQPNYGVLMPSTWPRLILSILAVLSFIYLLQSLKIKSTDKSFLYEDNLKGFLSYWRNPIISFCMFFLFLWSLPVLGMLIGGICFVFLLMSFLGGWEKKKIFIHAIIAILTVGLMWSLFTFGLGVMLPTGIIYNPFAL